MSLVALKLIALLSMTLDHVSKYLLFGGRSLRELICSLPVTDDIAYILYYCVIVPAGRIAFPVFAFMTANGCRRTRDLRAYLMRLALFAALSQIPFMLMCGGGTNVIFTFTLAVSAIYIFEYTGKKYWVLAISGAMAGAAAYLCRADYGAFGIAAVIAVYLANGRFTGPAALLAVMTAWLSTAMPQGSGIMYFASLLAAIFASCILLCFYTPGRGARGKWLFYIYYPAHMLAIYIINLSA